MRRLIIFAAMLTILLFAAGQGFSAILVVSVKGDASYKVAKGWTPLKKGQQLAEGTNISTGPRSKVVLNIDEHILTVNQMTTLRISKNSLTSDATENKIGLKYGSVDAKVKKIGSLKTIFKISTPVATSSVRGTHQLVSYGPTFGMIIVVYEGSVEGSNEYGVYNVVTGKLLFHLRGDKARVENLLAKLYGNSIVKIQPGRLTGDEGEYGDRNGDELIDNVDTDSFFNPAAGKARINVNIHWPVGR